MGKKLPLKPEVAEEDDIQIQSATELKKRLKIKRIKIFGDTGTGKTYFLLSQLLYHYNNGVQPEKMLMCVIDYDMDGISFNLTYLPDEILDRIKVIKAFDAEDGYKAVDIFVKKLIRPHLQKYPDATPYTYLVHENEHLFYMACRNHYTEQVYGMSEQEYMERRRKKEIQVGKSAVMKDENPRDVYASINRNFSDYFQGMMKLADYYGFQIITTTPSKQVIENWGMENQSVSYKAAGRPDLSDYWYDYIFSLWKERKIKNKEVIETYKLRSEKVRGITKPFIISNFNVEKLWRYIDEQDKKTEGTEGEE